MVCQHRRGREGTKQVYGTAEVTHTQDNLSTNAEVRTDQLQVRLYAIGHHRPLALIQQHGAAVVGQALAELADKADVRSQAAWLEWRCRSLTKAALMTTVTPEPEHVEREEPRSDNSPRSSWPTASSLVKPRSTTSSSTTTTTTPEMDGAA